MCSKSKENRKIGIVYRDFYREGGAPEEIRRLVNMSEGVQVYIGPKKNVSAVNCCALSDLAEVETCYIFGYSSFLNFFVTIYLWFKKVPVELIPLWQATKILDHDNPFRINTVPSVQKLQLKNYSRPKVSWLSKKIHVTKRIIYRRTLGKLLVSLSSRVLFFSEFEKSQFCKIHALRNSGEITFPTSLNDRPKGRDRLSPNTINVLYWGRVDAYYKGLDEVILNFDRYLKAIRRQSRIRIYICGPDYDNGKESVRIMIDQLGLSSFVKILEDTEYTPGTLGMLESSDYSIVCPVWDGYNRSCRESVLLGTPFIARNTANMDRLASRYGVGFIFSDPNELVTVYQKIENHDLIRDPDFNGAKGYLNGKPL